MSEAEARPAVPGPSAGAQLKQAREAAGLHIGALSVALKVPVRKIEALEADRLGELPDAVFTRALASSICRTLKVDPAPVLASLPVAVAPVLLATGESGPQAEFESVGGAARGVLLEQLSKPLVILCGALVVGAIAMWVSPGSAPVESRSSVSEVVAPTPRSGPVSAITAAPVEVGATQLHSMPAATSDTAVAAFAANAPSSALQLPVASVQSGVSVPGLQNGGATIEPQLSSQPGILQFKASAVSWIEVTDGKGVVQLRKTLAQGESAQVSGALPLRVIVGRADATSVLVRGAPFGLPVVTRDNVARFEVN